MNKRARIVWAIVSWAPLATASAIADQSSWESAGATYSYSSKENLNHAGAAGAVSVNRIEVSASGKRALSSTDRMTLGFSYTLTDLDRDAGTLLPDQLSEFALLANWSRRLSPRINASVLVRPGLYGDFHDIDARTLNMPVLLSASYVQSETLVWLLGVNLNANSDHPVLPIIGGRWQLAPDVTFSVGFPQTGFTWQWTDTVAVRAGVGFQGGTYRINDSPNLSPVSSRGLTHTYLDYREIRLGVGVAFKLAPALSLTVDAGSMLDRRFDYYDRDYALDGSSGLFGAVALRFTR